MISVLFDTNVVLDAFLARSPWDVEASTLLRSGAVGEIDIFLGAFSLPTIFYLARRHSGHAEANFIVRQCLDTFEIVPTDRGILELAAGMPAADFEDNVQIASAMTNHLDAIVTRDPKGFAASPIPAFSPAELSEQLSKMP